MKHITILVPERAVLNCIDGARMMFSGVNSFLNEAGEEEAFVIELAGLHRHVPQHNNLFTVHADKLISEIKHTDLIIIPAFTGDMGEAMELNQGFIPWILKQHRHGAEVASFCIGAFLLAETGLLNGQQCSTHWLSANEFRERYPLVELVDDRVITGEKGVYSSGGANSYWNLLLYLVEKYTNRAMAVLASKIYAIEIDRTSQSSFILFNGQKNHDDEEVRQAQALIEEHVADRISVGDLALQLAIGRRNFERRFKKATRNTPVEYIQRVKIEAAKKILETSRKNVTEVMYDVGYNDTKAFRSVFKKITGLSPLDYKMRYCKS